MPRVGEQSSMRPFRCDFLGSDGNLVRSVPLFAVDGDTAKAQATTLLDWLPPARRGGGLILWDGTAILLRIAGRS